MKTKYDRFKLILIAITLDLAEFLFGSTFLFRTWKSCLRRIDFSEMCNLNTNGELINRYFSVCLSSGKSANKANKLGWIRTKWFGIHLPIQQGSVTVLCWLKLCNGIEPSEEDSKTLNQIGMRNRKLKWIGF